MPRRWGFLGESCTRPSLTQRGAPGAGLRGTRPRSQTGGQAGHLFGQLVKRGGRPALDTFFRRRPPSARSPSSFNPPESTMRACTGLHADGSQIELSVDSLLDSLRDSVTWVPRVILNSTDSAI